MGSSEDERSENQRWVGVKNGLRVRWECTVSRGGAALMIGDREEEDERMREG